MFLCLAAFLDGHIDNIQLRRVGFTRWAADCAEVKSLVGTVPSSSAYIALWYEQRPREMYSVRRNLLGLENVWTQGQILCGGKAQWRFGTALRTPSTPRKKKKCARMLAVHIYIHILVALLVVRRASKSEVSRTTEGILMNMTLPSFGSVQSFKSLQRTNPIQGWRKVYKRALPATLDFYLNTQVGKRKS
jgi:hypothetical protein